MIRPMYTYTDTYSHFGWYFMVAGADLQLCSDCDRGGFHQKSMVF